MSQVGTSIVLLFIVGGIFLGFFLIYSVVTRREWLDKEFFRLPMSFGSKFMNMLQYVWLGIILIVFFSGLSWAIIKDGFRSIQK